MSKAEHKVLGNSNDVPKLSPNKVDIVLGHLNEDYHAEEHGQVHLE